jgi:hypothetical protein
MKEIAPSPWPWIRRPGGIDRKAPFMVNSCRRGPRYNRSYEDEPGVIEQLRGTLGFLACKCRLLDREGARSRVGASKYRCSIACTTGSPALKQSSIPRVVRHAARAIPPTSSSETSMMAPKQLRIRVSVLPGSLFKHPLSRCAADLESLCDLGRPQALRLYPNRTAKGSVRLHACPEGQKAYSIDEPDPLRASAGLYRLVRWGQAKGR